LAYEPKPAIAGDRFNVDILVSLRGNVDFTIIEERGASMGRTPSGGPGLRQGLKTQPGLSSCKSTNTANAAATTEIQSVALPISIEAADERLDTAKASASTGALAGKRACRGLN
jgi:hypothetical protein